MFYLLIDTDEMSRFKTTFFINFQKGEKVLSNMKLDTRVLKNKSW